MPTKHRWPTDPPGKAPSHSISWEQHQANAAQPSQGSVYVNGQRVTPEQYQAGVFLQGLQASAAVQGTPGSAPVPSVTPQPVDPAFEAARGGAQWNASLAGGEAAYQRGQTAYGTGYNADGSRNTANPYSQAMLLQDEYKRGVTGTNNSMAAQGQLYSGARVSAQARNDRLYAQGSDAQRRGAMDTYHGIGVGQLQAYGQNSLGVSSADYDALRRSIYGG